MKKQKKDLKPIEINTPKANRMKRLSRFRRLPVIKQIYMRRAYPDGLDNQTGSPIPINVSLDYEDQILPHVVTEHFIEMAGTIVLMDCPCRTANGCKNHDVKLGCTWLGEGAGKIDLSRWPGARLATKEEALERERLAYENGLVPHMGKLRDDAKIYNVLDYENKFMSICHCCSCCCVVAVMKYGPAEYKNVVKRMEGVEVEVNRDKCVGCGRCFKVCVYDAMKMKENKAMIEQADCKGCGRCEMVCPNGAISISFDGYDRIDEFIARFESRVDISS